MTVIERFLKYVSYDTQSNSESKTSPSTEKQLILGREIEREMNELGLKNVYMDECGNVIGTVPARGRGGKAIAFISHMDTAEDASGKNVRPRTVEYAGGDIALSGTMTLSPERFPELSELVGKRLIVTDGTTLLGADDKAGCAEIMEMARRIMESEQPHRELRIVITTDEEIGRGVEGLDTRKLDCEYGYTVDGGAIGEIEYECFNAATVFVTFEGVSIHLGSAKGIGVNSNLMAAAFQSMLPPDMVPEKTEGREGFINLSRIDGNGAVTRVTYTVRDHDRGLFEEKKKLLSDIAEKIAMMYPTGKVSVESKDTYYNMREKIEPHMHLIDKAKAAFRKNGVAPREMLIRGGTDGARLSYMGLPCPNLSTGGYNFHGEYEFIPVESLEKMPDILCDLVYSFTE